MLHNLSEVEEVAGQEGAGCQSFVLPAGSPRPICFLSYCAPYRGSSNSTCEVFLWGSDPKSHELLKGQSKVKFIHKVSVMELGLTLWTTSELEFQKDSSFPLAHMWQKGGQKAFKNNNT